MYFRLLDIEKDYDLLIEYCSECKKLGYLNNSSIERLNLTRFNKSLFLVGLENNKIVLINGAHNLNINEKDYFRVGYRGATIIKTSSVYKNILMYPGSAASCILMQVLEKRYNIKNFIMTTNSKKHSKDGSGKSHKADTILHRTPGHKLIFENTKLFNTVQNVWELDKQIYIKYFKKYHLLKHTFEEGLIDA